MLFHEGETASQDLRSFHFCLQSVSGKRQELFGIKKRYLLGGCVLHHRFCQRVFALLLEGTCQSEKFRFTYSFSWDHIRNAGFSPGDRTGLVESYDLDGTGLLKRLRILEKDPVSRSDTVTDHDGDRCGESQRTGAADHKHTDPPRECITETLSQQQPDHRGDHSYCNDHRNEVP